MEPACPFLMSMGSQIHVNLSSPYDSVRSETRRHLMQGVGRGRALEGFLSSAAHAPRLAAWPLGRLVGDVVFVEALGRRAAECLVRPVVVVKVEMMATPYFLSTPVHASLVNCAPYLPLVRGRRSAPSSVT